MYIGLHYYYLRLLHYIRPTLYCSLVFINNLINDKSKHKKQMLLFVLYCPGPSLLFITRISL